MSDSHFERKIDFSEYSCYILTSLVFTCLPVSLYNMNCSEEDKLMTCPRPHPGTPQCPPGCAIWLPGGIAPLHSKAQTTASTFSPSAPTKATDITYQWENQIRGGIRQITQMADGDKTSGLSLHKSYEFQLQKSAWVLRARTIVCMLLCARKSKETSF